MPTMDKNTRECTGCAHHSVQAACREHCSSKQARQRALSTTLCLSYFDMHYIATAMQNYCINKELRERGKRKDFDQYHCM